MTKQHVPVEVRAKLIVRKIPVGVECNIDRFVWEAEVKSSTMLRVLEMAEKVGEIELNHKKGTFKRIG